MTHRSSDQWPATGRVGRFPREIVECRHSTLTRGSAQLSTARAALLEALALVQGAIDGVEPAPLGQLADRLLAADETLRAGLSTLRLAVAEAGEAT